MDRVWWGNQKERQLEDQGLNGGKYGLFVSVRITGSFLERFTFTYENFVAV